VPAEVDEHEIRCLARERAGHARDDDLPPWAAAQMRAPRCRSRPT
jgi:hypothetical protein